MARVLAALRALSTGSAASRTGRSSRRLNAAQPQRHYPGDAGMKRKRALELQQEWGDKPCDHPSFAKEYDLGTRTGNFICTQCGTILSFREKGQLMASRRPLFEDRPTEDE
jgi:hypothetical protein